jgi:cysteine-rich repeat protein
MIRVPRRGRVALAAVLACVLGAGSADALVTKDLVNCQKTLDAQAAKLVKTRAKRLSGCVRDLLACQLANEIDGEPLAPCQAEAVADCGEAFTKAGEAAAKFTEKVATKCGIVPTADARSRHGLGFRDDADACAALTPPASVATTADALACAERAARCSADDRVEETVPRAYELLAAAGLAANAPCVDVRPAAPAGAGSTASDLLLDCQKVLDKEFAKVEPVREKAIRKCSGALFKCDLPVDRLEATVAERAECRADEAELCNEKRAGIGPKESARDAKVLAECGPLALVDLKDRLGFGLTCGAAASVGDLAACVAGSLEARSERGVGTIAPRACALLGASTQLTDYEDTCVPSCGNGVVEGAETCDDGNADPADRCTNACQTGPIDYETVLIASSATPPNTPDGTPANAVPGGSTLATQFGSTIFDLNRASYTRFFMPGAGDPDAVLVLVPGFAGGAGSFRTLAEHLLQRTDANAQIRLEVWAYERRSNQLEDTAGAEIAEDDLDHLLALDWFFGGSMSLTLDPRLSRRAVFHAGPDVAFIANFTPQVFAHDIDAVIEAARALPSAPAVFLGGHSLGTLFTARYAATDLDVGAPVLPGASKLAGLVLLEGGGGGLPTTPPTADDLDRVIAKADGGLFRAVQDNAARCVDGTPCTVDGDCSGVPLPAGALTNKCVATVEAYTGANPSAVAFINPYIQAAGHTIGIQGILDADGVSAVQQDFGGGSAVETEAGLGILRALPPASVEAAAGFFLDDDFSPIGAFRASFGFSDNGPNTMFLGLVVPGAAFSDPYRLWINFDQPQPAAAIPHNGPPTATLGDTWGQEKEVSSIGRFFPALFAGDIDFGDWYFPSSGLSVTSELNGGGGGFGGLDSTPLSVGRNRPDIENLTQASAVNIPVIAIGASNGLTPTAASYKAFANSIGTCTAPSCSGATARLLVDDPITPTFGDVAGGYEVVIVEGYAHVDVVTAEDDPLHNTMLGPIVAFLERNTP